MRHVFAPIERSCQTRLAQDLRNWFSVLCGSSFIAEATRELLWNVRQQSIGLCLDHLVALTTSRFEAGPIQYRDTPAAVSNQTSVLQLAGRFSDVFATNAQHVGDQFLRHRELVGWQTIKTEYSHRQS
jgi:hypothetical protein